MAVNQTELPSIDSSHLMGLGEPTSALQSMTYDCNEKRSVVYSLFGGFIQWGKDLLGT